MHDSNNVFWYHKVDNIKVTRMTKKIYDSNEEFKLTIKWWVGILKQHHEIWDIMFEKS